ncbi:pyrroline-5-carboxylate reductase family protein [Qipengyuania sp. MTN3-11]|uniref:pyrroline-5-carboxylate reductase family protein n=1 Tax=Qipengyuania sp. MTN3-11 TaxID=3056557 RepID=UPI0036F2A4D0
MNFESILIYGYGTMSSAMLEGWLASGLAPDSFTVFNPRTKNVPESVAFTDEIPAASFDAVVLGFKPHMLADIAPAMQPVCGNGTTVISVLAGVELDTLSRRFPQARAVVRFMPNLAVALGKSPNAVIGAGLDDGTKENVTDLAERLGTAEWIADEAQFDLVTALAGSGPGFVYRFIEALAAGGEALGLNGAQAERLAVQMVEGAAALAAASPYASGELAARVASPGGMTQKGLDVLDRDAALVRLLTETLRAARDRGREMAANARDQG